MNSVPFQRGCVGGVLQPVSSAPLHNTSALAVSNESYQALKALVAEGSGGI